MYIDIHTHNFRQQENVKIIRNYIFGVDACCDKHLFSSGVHPWYLSNVNIVDELFSSKVVANANFVAVGECGMDMTPAVLDKYPLKLQKDIFIRQLYWAEKHQKPVIIHCVRCFDKLLQINKQLKHRNAWVIHGFSKQKAIALQLIQAGFYLSFGAQIFESVKNRQALQAIPLNRLFLETDEQKQYDIVKIYKEAASIKAISVSKLQNEIISNFQKVFTQKNIKI